MRIFHYHRHRLLILVAAALVAAPATLAAAQKARTAEEIVDAAFRQGAVGFHEGTAEMQMTLVDKSGKSKERTLEIAVHKGRDGAMQSKVRFLRPAEVSGITFLMREKKGQLPDQYVYIPATKIVRRIAAGTATTSFFGSDFTYADLMPLPPVEGDNVKLSRLADATVGGQAAVVVEIVPVVEGAPYGKVIAYIHETLMLPLKVEFFDTDRKALKTLKIKKIKKIEDRYLPVEMEMEHLQNGSTTVLALSKIDPHAKLDDAHFTEEALRR